MCLYFFGKAQIGTNASDLKFSSPTCINFIMCLVGQQMFLGQVNINVCACIFFSKAQIGTNASDLKFSSPASINFIACKSDLFWFTTSDKNENERLFRLMCSV